MKNFLYLHGGPGINSFAEEHLFQEYLSPTRGYQFYFWNEPFTRSSAEVLAETALDDWINSAKDKLVELFQEKGPIHLVGHSFAVVACVNILQSAVREAVASVTLITPSFSLNDGYRRLLNIAHEDFKQMQSEKAEKLFGLMQKSTDFFDEPMREGLMLALEDPLLFSRYFYNSENVKKYFSAWERRQGQFNVGSFFAVLDGLASRMNDVFSVEDQISVPVQLIFGNQDPFILSEPEIQFARRLFKNVKVHIVDESGHYPHIEKMDLFFNCLEA